MKVNKLFGMIATSLQASLPEGVTIPEGVEPILAFTSHLTPQGQILTAAIDGREFYIEERTPCLFPGFLPENEGNHSFVRSKGGFPEEYHTAVVVIPASKEPTCKRLFAVFHVGNCLHNMQQWFDRPLVRHYRDGKCVWAGFDSPQTPKPTADTIVEKRPVGETVWLRPVSAPSPFAALEGFVATTPAPQEETWSPTGAPVEETGAEASVTSGGIIPIESGKSEEGSAAPSGTGRRVTPPAPRAKKKSAATPTAEAPAEETVAKASGE